MHKNLSDAKIVDLCLQNDKAAWEHFIERFSGIVNKAVELKLTRYNFIFCEQDVKDIKQDVFLSILEKKKLNGIKDRKKIANWLVLVAGHAAVDYIRNRNNQNSKIYLPINEESLNSIPVLTDRAHTPYNEAVTREFENSILELISKYRPKVRLILKLNLLYGMTNREISKMLGIPMGTVCTTLRDTKTKLKKEIKRIFLQ